LTCVPTTASEYLTLLPVAATTGSFQGMTEARAWPYQYMRSRSSTCSASGTDDRALASPRSSDFVQALWEHFIWLLFARRPTPTSLRAIHIRDRTRVKWEQKTCPRSRLVLKTEPLSATACGSPTITAHPHNPCTSTER